MKRWTFSGHCDSRVMVMVKKEYKAERQLAKEKYGHACVDSEMVNVLNFQYAS